jgi:hypothetical protein
VNDLAADGDDAAGLFTSELSALEERLTVPYPERADLLEEASADLCAAYRQERARGIPREEARARSLRRLAIDEEARQALDTLHASLPARALGLAPPAVRSWLGAVASGAPLAWLILLLFIAGVAAVTTVGRRSGRPGSTAAAWAVAILAAGSLGYGVGQRRVNAAVNHAAHAAATTEGRPATPPDAQQIEKAQERVALLSEGTSEAAANYLLAGISALLVSALGGLLVLFRRGKRGPAAELAPSVASAQPVRG